MSTDSENDPTNEDEHRRGLLAQLELLGELGSTEAALFHQLVAQSVGLGLTEMKTLSVLLREGAMTAGQIAERLALTTGAVTNLVDRLLAKGLVQRQADPKDRRKVVVSADQSKLFQGPNPYAFIGEAFARLHRGYTTDQLEFLVEYHRAEVELTRQAVQNLKNPQGPAIGGSDGGENPWG